MKQRLEGSYTVEGTIIISCMCLIVGLTILLGFYSHDQAVMQATADELAMLGSLWSGRYMHPENGDVDYEKLKSSETVTVEMLENKGYEMMGERLFIGEIQSVSIFQRRMQKEIQVKVRARFRMGGWEFYHQAESIAVDFHSRDFPRSKERGEGT